MEDLQWKDEYSVGVEKLDQQHKQILALIEQIISRPAHDPVAIADTLAAMLKYAQEHFTCEEELMQDHGYIELAQQEKQHKYFLKKAAEFSLHAFRGDKAVLTDILDFLAKWWITHILKWDMKYKYFFQKISAERQLPQASA